MAKIGETQKQDPQRKIINYPKGYYTENDPFVADSPYLKMNGRLLLIHDDGCRGVSQLPAVWRKWDDVKCPKCLIPFMVAVTIVPTEPFDNEWNFSREVFSGGHPDCYCNPKLINYKDVNKPPFETDDENQNYSILTEKSVLCRHKSF